MPLPHLAPRRREALVTLRFPAGIQPGARPQQAPSARVGGWAGPSARSPSPPEDDVEEQLQQLEQELDPYLQVALRSRDAPGLLVAIPAWSRGCQLVHGREAARIGAKVGGIGSGSAGGGGGWHQTRGHAARAPPVHVHLADPCARLSVCTRTTPNDCAC